MQSFDYNKYLQNNPLLKENDFPSAGEVINAASIDYDMVDYFNRTNKQLIVTMKNGEKIECTVGKLYNDLTFFGEFPDKIANVDYQIQKKYFDSIEITN
jgi:hypothetical protein